MIRLGSNMKYLQKILCKIGNHQWEDITPSYFPIDIKHKQCKKCKIKQTISYYYGFPMELENFEELIAEKLGLNFIKPFDDIPDYLEVKK